MRTIKDYFLLTLKGMGMGASDVVPGVSGGTIAFITGIYEELIHSIKSINLDSLSDLFKFKLKDFWKKINGNFLLAVFSGVLISVFTLANILEYLLVNHPVYIWSFFFGLVVASAIIILKDIKKWNLSIFISLLLGIVIAFWITTITPTEPTKALWFVFISGSLAICAMILPGISGSFILVLLGMYQHILSAVSNLDFIILLVFMGGAIIGLILFSNFLSWLLKKSRFQTIALLAGFMGGSLNKIWPWKITTETFIDRHGVIQPIIQKNILPEFGFDTDFFPALGIALGGFLLIWILSSLTISNSEKK